MKIIQTALMILSTTFIIGVYSPVVGAATDTPSLNPADHLKHHPKGKAQMEPTPEMRKKMAETHQAMADCLKSDKPMTECKQEMMKNCPMMKESGRCTMMDQMGGEMGEMMGGSEMKKMGKKPSSDEAGHEEHHPEQK